MSEMLIKQQTEQRANLIAQMREVIDQAEERGDGMSQEELQKIERIEADITRADETIATAERAAHRAAEARDAAGDFVPAETAQTEGDVFRSLARGELRDHYFGAWNTRATLVPATDTVRQDFSSNVLLLARAVGPMLEEGTLISRDSGESLRIPTLDAYSTAAQYAAGSAISDSEPTFGSVLLEPKKQAFIIKVASELADDQSFPLEQTLQTQAGNAIGFQVNNLLTVGTGTTETTGVVTAAASAVEAGTTSFTADNLIDLSYSLDSAARALQPKFMMNTSTLGALRKLKDNDGRYIYDPTSIGGQTLLGFPVVENSAMADIGTGARSVVFGVLSSYSVLSTGLSVAVSQDAYFANDIIGYRFTFRVDGALSHSSHVKALVHA